MEALVSEEVCCVLCPHSIFQLRNRGQLSGPLLSAKVTWTLERSECFSPSQDGGMMEGEFAFGALSFIHAARIPHN